MSRSRLITTIRADRSHHSLRRHPFHASSLAQCNLGHRSRTASDIFRDEEGIVSRADNHVNVGLNSLQARPTLSRRPGSTILNQSRNTEANGKNRRAHSERQRSRCYPSPDRDRDPQACEYKGRDNAATGSYPHHSSPTRESPCDGFRVATDGSVDAGSDDIAICL